MWWQLHFQHHCYIGYISVMLASFPTLPCALPDKGRWRRGIIRDQGWRLPVPVVRWRLLDFTLQQIFWCAVASYVTSLLNPLFFVSSLHCIYNMDNTRPHLCMQPCKQDEWRERVHLPHGSLWGFQCDCQSLDVSLKMLNDFQLSTLFCVLCTLFSL